ncbi:MAG: hypothetical protein NTU53_21550 [Planctomycetota bacterium]|nr:hypothetical protein [Planctomycetota bacterium]
MKRAVMLLALLASGCSAYTEAQMRLVHQAHRGVELCRAAQRERSLIVEQFHQLQRQRMDEAFDVDVRENSTLLADWVIEHRKAYAAALDALSRQGTASAEAQAAAERNLEAVEQALNRVLWLQSVQLKLTEWDGMANLEIPREKISK